MPLATMWGAIFMCVVSERQLQHSLQRLGGTAAQLFLNPDLRCHIAQTVAQLLQGVELHVFAFIAGAFLYPDSDEFLTGNELAQTVQNPHLCHNNKLPGFAFPAIGYHLFRGTNMICHHPDRFLTFRVTYHLRIRILSFQFQHLVAAEPFVYMAGSIPHRHFSSRLHIKRKCKKN